MPCGVISFLLCLLREPPLVRAQTVIRNNRVPVRSKLGRKSFRVHVPAEH